MKLQADNGGGQRGDSGPLSRRLPFHPAPPAGGSAVLH